MMETPCLSLGRNRDTPRLTIAERHRTRSPQSVSRTASRSAAYGLRSPPPGPSGTAGLPDRVTEGNPKDTGN